MEGVRFEAVVRALSALRGRRQTLALLSRLLGVLAGISPAFLDATSAKKKHKNNQKKRRKRRRRATKGPCGRGPANRCQRDNQCCTGYCHKKRCRCRKLNQSCTEDRHCCPQQTGRTCRDGACQEPEPACGDVCASGCQYSSVQDAIDAASAGDTITICAGTFSGNITITEDLTLVGAGEDATTLQGNGPGTVVTIALGSVTLQDLTITGSIAAELGGGIFNSGTLAVTDCTVSDNSAHRGGGIANNGTLTLTDCTVSGNEATDGGGILNTNTLTMSGGAVSGNFAVNGGGIDNAGTVALQDGATVTANHADTDGGGMYNDGLGGSGTSSCSGGSSVSGNTPNDCVEVNSGDCGTC